MCVPAPAGKPWTILIGLFGVQACALATCTNPTAAATAIVLAKRKRPTLIVRSIPIVMVPVWPVRVLRATRSTTDLNRGDETAQGRDDAVRHDPAGARVGRRGAVAADQREADILRFDGHRVHRAGPGRIGPDLDPRALEADRGEAQRDGDIEMARERRRGFAAGRFPDLHGLLRRRREVEAALADHRLVRERV